MTNPHKYEYRKKPVVIQAFHMTQKHRWSNEDWPEWLHEAWQLEPQEGALWCEQHKGEDHEQLYIGTKEGVYTVTFDDWIIRGVEGEIYACKPSIFEATYEKVNGN